MRLAQLSTMAGAMRRALNIGERLGGEDHRDVALTQCLQPLADATGEDRVVEEDPRFVENQQDRRPVEAVFEAPEEIRQHRQHGGAPVHQLFHLEALNGGRAQPVFVRIEEAPAGAAQDVRLQRLT